MMQGHFVTRNSQVAVLAALELIMRSRRNTRWVTAAELAAVAGAPSADDAEFEAVVRSLQDAGAISLKPTGEGSDAGKSAYQAMLVRPV
jgi:hypothetical protein